MILACTIFYTDQECDGRTDGRTDGETDAQAMAKTRKAFCCRA